MNRPNILDVILLRRAPWQIKVPALLALVLLIIFVTVKIEFIAATAFILAIACCVWLIRSVRSHAPYWQV